MRNKCWANYQINCKKLRDEIKKAKKLSWKKLLVKIDGDIWGNGYKIVTRCTISYTPRTRLTLEKMQEIDNYLFPTPSVLGVTIRSC